LGFFVVAGISPAAQAKTLFGDFFKDKGVEVSVSGAADVYTQYIWRGFRLDKDPVVQPSFTVSANGFSANVWGSYDLVGDDSLASDEVDTTLSYAHTFKDMRLGDIALAPITVSGGNIYYEYSGLDTFTSEFFAGVTYGSFLSPAVTYYYDYIDESQGGGDGTYLMFSLAQSVPLNKDYGVSLDLSGHVGFNNEDYMSGEGGDFFAKAGLALPLTESLKLTPSVNYSVPFGDLKDSGDGNQKEYVYYGASLSFVF
jgi:hypothetical protein